MAAGRPEILLVVNADDFGFSPEISRGIVTACREGIVTSTSVLGNCPDLPAASALLQSTPSLGVGVQLTLVGGAPLTDPADIPSLVGPAGRFPSRARDVLVAWARGRLQPSEIDREFEAQVTRLKSTGLPLDHFNTHHHLGFIPPVGLAVEAVARRHGIPGVRSAVEQPNLAWVTELARGAVAAALGGLSWLTRRQMGALRHGPQTWGYVESGQLDEVRILEIVGRLGPGSHELICHPGEVDDAPPPPGQLGAIHYRRARELAALTSPLVRTALERRDVRLCRWGELF
jgi:chitin disaccharide deacetylase